MCIRDSPNYTSGRKPNLLSWKRRHTYVTFSRFLRYHFLRDVEMWHSTASVCSIHVKCDELSPAYLGAVPCLEREIRKIRNNVMSRGKIDKDAHNSNTTRSMYDAHAAFSSSSPYILRIRIRIQVHTVQSWCSSGIILTRWNNWRYVLLKCARRNEIEINCTFRADERIPVYERNWALKGSPWCHRLEGVTVST